jgi:hypothetical protein
MVWGRSHWSGRSIRGFRLTMFGSFVGGCMAAFEIGTLTIEITGPL